LLAIVAIAALAAGEWVGLSPEALRPKLAELHKNEPDFTRRFLDISKNFEGAPYLFSPLGEGPGHPPDADPLFRTDTFDCLSLVETSLALAADPDLDQALQTLQKIRYTDGHVDFAWRKHFPESQWLPQNHAWLTDITHDIGGELAVRVQKAISPESYATRKQALDLVLPKERVPNGVFRWWVIPLADVEKVMTKIPSGTLLWVVREDFRSTPFRISHVGIVVQHKSGTYLRHAKEGGVHKVVEMPLMDVVRRHQEFTRWPAIGVSLYTAHMP
jgi:hypothetical protein